ncbi:MAG: hypothetical protein QY322_00035 [bacterium]|nr:MAG: hypothetical protein QY322_00035 [bacterium]
MEITYKDKEIRIKGKTGSLYPKQNGVLIESLDGNYKKELYGPGEYEVSGISVIGIKNDEGNIFVYEVDGVRICNLTEVSKKLTDTKVSTIGDIDILLLSENGEEVEILQQVESYYCLPVNFSTQESLDKFLRESGLVVETVNKFTVKKDDLIEDSAAQVIVLST